MEKKRNGLSGLREYSSRSVPFGNCGVHGVMDAHRKAIQEARKVYALSQTPVAGDERGFTRCGL